MLEQREAAKVVKGSGDIFADLGLEVDEKELLKFEIAREITAIVSKGKLTQVQVAEIIGVDQAKVSALLRGRLRGFSVERLIYWLLRLGYDIDVHFSKAGARKKDVRNKPEQGEVRVHHAVAARR